MRNDGRIICLFFFLGMFMPVWFILNLVPPDQRAGPLIVSIVLAGALWKFFGAKPKSGYPSSRLPKDKSYKSSIQKQIALILESNVASDLTPEEIYLLKLRWVSQSKEIIDYDKLAALTNQTTSDVMAIETRALEKLRIVGLLVE